MRVGTTDETTLAELEAAITNDLAALQTEALKRYGAITGRNQSLHSFHATIGGKNNTYVDSVRTEFSDFRDFLAQWLYGLRCAASGQAPSAAALRIARLLQDDLLQKYTFLFLERNFYRNYHERTRFKPDASLWRLWFGSNSLVWGLIIAPVLRKGEWTNDKSEMRRARYSYWTIGHVLEVGLVDPQIVKPYGFRSLGDLLSFYRSILKRVSNSIYEQAIADRYISYIEDSSDPMSEPFLIPELRYAGLGKCHKYRLDYTILNCHTMSFVGFELSPHSTHYAVDGLANKTQKEVNKSLAIQWEKEMAKRNEYFATFGITTLTFADRDLTGIDRCFGMMVPYFRGRPAARRTVESELMEIRAIV